MFHAPPYRIILGVGQNECYRLEVAQSRDVLVLGTREHLLQRGALSLPNFKGIFLINFLLFRSTLPHEAVSHLQHPAGFPRGHARFCSPDPSAGLLLSQVLLLFNPCSDRCEAGRDSRQHAEEQYFFCSASKLAFFVAGFRKGCGELKLCSSLSWRLYPAQLGAWKGNKIAPKNPCRCREHAPGLSGAPWKCQGIAARCEEGNGQFFILLY